MGFVDFIPFIALGGTLVIYIKQIRDYRKMKDLLNEKQESLTALYNDMEEAINDFCDYALETKEDIARDKKVVQKTVEQLKGALYNFQSLSVLLSKEVNPQLSLEVSKNIVKDVRKAKKTAQLKEKKKEQVDQLYEQGMSITEIAKNLGMGKGEVQLILNLKKLQ